jgi:hypothetical protein
VEKVIFIEKQKFKREEMNVADLQLSHILTSLPNSLALSNFLTGGGRLPQPSPTSPSLGLISLLTSSVSFVLKFAYRFCFFDTWF